MYKLTTESNSCADTHQVNFMVTDGVFSLG